MLPTYEMHNETALIVFRRAVDRLRGMPSVTARTLAFAVLLLAGDAATAADGPVWFDLYSAYAVPVLAARIHDLARNDGWASGGVTRQVDAVIGAGWRLSSKPNARSLKIDPDVASDLASDIEAAWKDYAEDPDCWCDAGRRLSMGGLLALAFRHRLMDGDALAVILWLPGGGPSPEVARSLRRFVSGAQNPVSRKRRPPWAETRFECGAYDEGRPSIRY
jgi:hypothetical protein